MAYGFLVIAAESLAEGPKRRKSTLFSVPGRPEGELSGIRCDKLVFRQHPREKVGEETAHAQAFDEKIDTIARLQEQMNTSDRKVEEALRQLSRRALTLNRQAYT
jgi:transposase